MKKKGPLKTVVIMKCQEKGCDGWHHKEKKGYSNCSICGVKYER